MDKRLKTTNILISILILSVVFIWVDTRFFMPQTIVEEISYRTCSSDSVGHLDNQLTALTETLEDKMIFIASKKDIQEIGRKILKDKYTRQSIAKREESPKEIVEVITESVDSDA